MALGDLKLTRSGHRSWIHLDENQQAIYGKDGGHSLGAELVLSLQLWMPMIGIVISYFLFNSTVETMIELNIPDLVVALLYSGSFVFLFYGPSALLGRAGTEYAKRSAPATVLESGRSSSEDRRWRAERLWRSVIAAGFLMTGFGLSSIVHLPMLFGIPLGLVILRTRFEYRKRHLEKCRLVRRAPPSAIPSRRTMTEWETDQ